MALCTRRVMIVEEFSNKYKVRLLTCDDINEIYELERKNILYYEFCPPFVTRQSILEDMEALPPGKSKDDKYYIGFFQEGRLVAVMDFIDGFPEKKIAFIGFFMVDVSFQKKRIGTEIIDDLCSYLRNLGYSSLRLAWVKGNPQSEGFWLKNSFRIIKETKSNFAETAILAERIL